jgi:hypothetical protein
MAVTKVSTRRDMREYRLVCMGLGQKELFELYHVFRDEQGFDASLRNPFLPEFGPGTVHEILLTGAAAAGAVGTKLLDLISTVVKRKLEERDAGNRKVTIYDHNGRPYSVVEIKPPKKAKR